MMLLGLATITASACGNGASTGGTTPNAGSVVLDMSLAPTNARCVVITVTPQGGGTAVTQSFTLTPEAQTVFTLSNLPLGTVTISEQVFTVACNATTGATPGWISQAQTVSLDPGEPVTLALTLVPNATGGQVSIQNTFVTSTPTLNVFTVSPGLRANVRGMTPGPDGEKGRPLDVQYLPGHDEWIHQQLHLGNRRDRSVWDDRRPRRQPLVHRILRG
jgi:hypothetical protein